MANKTLPPLLIATGLIAYRGVRAGSSANNPVAHLPLPSQFVGAFLVFGLLSMATGQAEKPAQMAAWGLDVAILLNLWKPGSSVDQKSAGEQTTTTAAAAPTKKGN